MLEEKLFIFGACNPMIDITANVTHEFLSKYNLRPNDAILGEDHHLKIYDDMKQKHGHTLTYTAGGSGYNTLRIASWILGIPNVNVFMGCVGQDEYAEIIANKAEEAGLRTLFQTTCEATTATCATLLTDQNRSLVAHLGAARRFTQDHLDNYNIWSYVENSRLFYITGFFITTCFKSIIRIASFCEQNERLFCLNLSALFLTEFYKKEFTQILPYVDILFGNDTEAISFARHVLNIQTTDVKKIARHIATMRKINKRKRHVIITRAEKPVIYTNGIKLNEFEVPVVELDKIIDTSCAGDAFCGGFLAQLVKNASIEKCIDCGIWASSVIIQRPGCDIPINMRYI